MTASERPSRTTEPAHESDTDAWAARVSAGVAAGSRESFAALYQARFDWLYATVRRATRGDESFALDCVQDAMIRVATKLERMESAASLDAWLRRVVLTAALDRLRSERSQATRAEAGALHGRQPSEEAERELEVELVRLDAMSREERSLLGLRFVRGLTLAQLAEHLGLAPKAVDSRIRRIVARLRGDAATTDDGGRS